MNDLDDTATGSQSHNHEAVRAAAAPSLSDSKASSAQTAHSALDDGDSEDDSFSTLATSDTEEMTAKRDDTME